MARPRKKHVKPARYPFVLPSRSPLDGKPWTLPEPTLRDIVSHLWPKADAFGRHGIAAFVTMADADARDYKRRARDPARKQLRATLHRLEKAADALRRAQWAVIRLPADEAGLLRLYVKPGEAVSPAELYESLWPKHSERLVRAASKLRQDLTRGGRPLASLARYHLVGALWRSYPPGLQRLSAGGHFETTVRLVLAALEPGAWANADTKRAAAATHREVIRARKALDAIGAWCK